MPRNTRSNISSRPAVFDHVSKTIKKFRVESKKKQIEVAADIKLSARHYQKIEAGQVDLNLSTLELLSKSLAIEPCYLLRSVQKKASEDLGIVCPASILDLLPVGVQVCNAKGEVTYLNKFYRDLLGLQEWKMHNNVLHIWDFLAEASEAESLKIYLKLLVQEQLEPTPYYGKEKTASGKIVPIKVSWSYLFDSSKNVIGFVSLITPHPSW